MERINLNGQFIPPDQPIFSPSNRAFRYGDALFESIRKTRSQIPLLARHLQRLEKGMRFLGLQWPSHVNLERIEQEIIRTADLLEEARIRLTVFREDGGLYTPASDEAAFLIQVNTVSFPFPWQESGQRTGLCQEWKVPASPLTSFKTANALLYVLASREKKQRGLDECLLLNQKGRIAEGCSSNLFLLDTQGWRTPPIEEGCLPGVMRQTLLELLPQSGMPVQEKPILPADMHSAEAAVLTNAVQGVRWIGQFEETRYEPSALLPLQQILRDWQAD